MDDKHELIGGEETRDCPFNCYGSLKENGDGGWYCPSCHCTPDGEFHDPPEKKGKPTYDVTWDEKLESTKAHETGRERYRVSNLVQLVGGFQDPWPQEWLSREDSLI